MSNSATNAAPVLELESDEPAWSAFDELSTVVIVADRGLRCRFANRAALRWLGRADLSQVLDRPGEDLVEPDVWQAALPNLSAALAGARQRTSVTLTDAGGGTVRAHVTCTPQLRRGEVVGVLVELVDITADLAAERELRREVEEAAVAQERERVAAEATTLVSRPLLAASLELSAVVQDSRGVVQTHVQAAIRDLDTALAELRELVVGSASPVGGTTARPVALLGEPTAELAAANVGDMIATLDAGGRYEWVSPSATLVTGWAPADLLGRSVFELVHPDDETLLRARWAEQVAGARLVGLEYRRRRPDGSYQWVETRMRPLPGPGGTISGSVLSIRDISERRRLQAELTEALETFELSFTSAPIGKALVAHDGRWLKVNPALSAIVGRSQAELLAGSVQDITHPDDVGADEDLVGEVLRGERDGYEIEKRYLRPDGREVWVLLHLAGARHPDGTFRFFIVQVQDISRRRADAQALQHRADHDSLTGLENRRRFAVALADCSGPGRRASDRPVLLALDLDGFKAINDTHGHAAGDAHLREVAAVLRDSVRAGDRCARLGGDEFAVLLADADPRTADEIAERIRVRITALGRGGVSVGVAPWEPGRDVDRWMSAADGAMYRQKNSAAAAAGSASR